MNTRPKRGWFGMLALVALLAGFEAGAQGPALANLPAGVQEVVIDEPSGQILSFLHLADATVVEMRGTKIVPTAAAKMKIESRPGFLEIDINRGDIKGLEHARRFGRDFLTYVLWAVSVDGEAMNLGEITFDRGGSPVGINVTTPYQTFWLMVTAEPDFAVNDPSPVVVLYSINQDNVVTTNKAQPVPGKLSFYTYYHRYNTAPAEVVMGIPNEILQARKAVELASKSGILAVERTAGEEPLPDEDRTRQTLAQARGYLQQAEDTLSGGGVREAIQFARTAAQIAENARALALGAVGGVYVRQLDRELNNLRAEAEQLRAEAARIRAESGPLREEADRLRRANQELNTQLANSQKELASVRDRLQQLEGALDLERRRGRELETQLFALRERSGLLEQQLADSRGQTSLLAEDREKICAELRRQLNSLGQLTQQGGSMVLTLASDILFDFNSYDLRPTARENLAKLAVLRLLLFPEADVRYEGHTDRVGDDAYNQWLSEQRALSVYRYFLEERLALEADPGLRGIAQRRLATVQQLLGMNFAAAQRNQTQRLELIAQLDDTVIGKGEREPVVDTQAAEERNRRVVLLFPPAQLGHMTSLCEAQVPGPSQ
ncbi:MAG: OmpA family protein [Acidobacteria bacterium]|nr:OmpA family protein [Acidobacteriota bacterium]